MAFCVEKLNKIKEIYSEYLRLEELLTYEEVLLDKKLCYKYEQDRNKLSAIANKYSEYLTQEKSLQEFEKLALSDTNDSHLLQEEVNNIKVFLSSLENDMISLLNNLKATDSSITVEILNKNADILTELICNGYNQYALTNNLELSSSTIKNTTTLVVRGANAKDRFMGEKGIHINTTDNSCCQVFVYDSFNEAIPTFNEENLNITIARSSGAGGQHINTTDSAIKITHIPTGITAICQSERSQIQNREKALNNLKEKVMLNYEKNRLKHIEAGKKEQLKLMRNNHIVKWYDCDNGIITTANKRSFTIKDFLLGKEI